MHFGLFVKERPRLNWFGGFFRIFDATNLPERDFPVLGVRWARSRLSFLFQVRRWFAKRPSGFLPPDFFAGPPFPSIRHSPLVNKHGRTRRQKHRIE